MNHWHVNLIFLCILGMKRFCVHNYRNKYSDYMLKSSMYHYPLITMLYKCSYIYNTLQPLRTSLRRTVRALQDDPVAYPWGCQFINIVPQNQTLGSLCVVVRTYAMVWASASLCERSIFSAYENYTARCGQTPDTKLLHLNTQYASNADCICFIGALVRVHYLNYTIQTEL